MIWILWLIFIVARASIDSDKYMAWKDTGNYTIKHGNNFVIGIIASALSYFLFNHNGIDLVKAICFITASGASYSLIFNLLFNAFSELPGDYLGTESWLDRMEAKIPSRVFTAWMKFICTGAGVSGYYYY